MMNYIYFDKEERRDVCWHCGGRLIWGTDHDAESLGFHAPGIVTHLHCSQCNAHVEYVKLEEEE